MSPDGKISAAIAAHGMWKTRLSSAISLGKSEFSPSDVAKDDKCDFGKWLHGIADARITTSADYRECRDLHRDFHALAAKVLSIALAGKKDEAERAVAPDGDYANLSARLTRAMMAWQRKPL